MRRGLTKAVIGKVTRKSFGWDVALAPDNTTWLSVYEADGFKEPKVGDVITVMPPQAISIETQRSHP